jgi:isoquinoline 1-oxidoreductase alpha subunit
MLKLEVDGTLHEVDAPPEKPLLPWALRDVLGHTGVKLGRGMDRCGACTVHLAALARRART